MDNKELNTNQVNNDNNVNNTPQSNMQNTELVNNQISQTEVVNNPQNVEETKTNEVRIINNEIELVFDEPKKEEEVIEVEQNVEVVKKKRILPFIDNDDLILLVAGIILVLVCFNLENINKIFFDKKYVLDPTPVVTTPVVDEQEETDDVTVIDTKEYTLNCSKKNSKSDYAFDYLYTINYKGNAYKMVYEIKSVDFSDIEDDEEYSRKLVILNEFLNNSFEYTENANNIDGSVIKMNEDGTFTQTIDLEVAKIEDINMIEEVMFFDVDDSIDEIKTKFKKNGYTCK